MFVNKIGSAIKMVMLLKTNLNLVRICFFFEDKYFESLIPSCFEFNFPVISE